MKEIEKIAQDLFDKIRSRFSNVTIGTAEAKATTDPEQARFFNFDFIKNGENYGNLTISLADDNSLKVYYGKSISEKMDEDTKQAWYKFLKSIRFFAKRNMLTFDTRDISRNNLTSRDVKTISAADGSYSTDELAVNESKLYGTSRSSYEKIGPVKIVIRHEGKVDENIRGSRTRQIAAIYVENTEGERIKVPFKNISGARAMARHIQNGGTMTDTIGEHITSLVNEMSNLRVFVRNMRGKTFEDMETTQMVESAIDYYGSLHEKLHKLKGQRGYKHYVAEFKPTEIDNSDFNEDELRERFTRKLFDDRMSSALGSVYKAYKMRQQIVPETALGSEFEAWADDMLEGTWETSDEDDKELNSQGEPDAGLMGDDERDEDEPTNEVVDRYDAQADFIDDVIHKKHGKKDSEDTFDPDEKSAEEESLEIQFLKKLSGIK